ncbi:hypothetical protein SOVF_155850, partial [Spinacia oleracea]
VVDDY